MQFCRECNHMLYPEEDQQQKMLMLTCRNCNFKEEAANKKVFTHQIAELEEQKAIPWKQIANDVTLPRSYAGECRECDGTEIVYLQVQYKTKVSLYYVCATCGAHWTQDIEE
eukprot:TRINITY_DN7580_c0_g1_i1.p2 TRINITY_DN7580_c0_g1~~TRINITY_DN7580_c0_g1_i1.p2  ORF type:complete len:112 (-),score=33.70 TRINITY_DN7580_c0_g1_i1:178-513(-)